VTSARRLLIVEDDPATLDLFCTALRRSGFEVDGVPTVADALAALGERRYAVVMADHVLPDVTGLDFLAALQGAVGDTALVLCSGVLTDELRAEAEGFGFAVLEKPVGLERLVETLATAVRRRGPMTGR
jgi:DNA-binding response OmpR family regulator